MNLKISVIKWKYISHVRLITTERNMLVERNENQKVELRERERMREMEREREINRETETENSERAREIGQRRQIRKPEHTRRIRVRGNKHKELWLDFIQFIQLSPANSILKVGSSQNSLL